MARQTRRSISPFSRGSIERNISKRDGENLWNSEVGPLISLSPRRGMDAEDRAGETGAMAERIRPIEQMLELSEEESMSPELLDTQVPKAQEQLLQLRRRGAVDAKQKRELEELSRRQEE